MYKICETAIPNFILHVDGDFVYFRVRNAQNASSCAHEQPLNEGNFSLRIVKPQDIFPARMLNLIVILHAYTATGFEADDGGRNHNQRLQQQWEYCQHLQWRLQMGQRWPQPGAAAAVITGHHVAHDHRTMEHMPASLEMNTIHPDHEGRQELPTSTEPLASCGQQDLRLPNEEEMCDFVDKRVS